VASGFRRSKTIFWSVIVDEAHKMAAYSADKKTLAYKLGEALSAMTDHYLLMTATPHKGVPENFCLFLELLDRDIYGSVKSLEEAMRRNSAPFYLRRTKEALVSFPDPETGIAKKLFTKRDVRTASFELDGDEYDFYDALTRYVEDQSIKGLPGPFIPPCWWLRFVGQDARFVGQDARFVGQDARFVGQQLRSLRGVAQAGSAIEEVGPASGEVGWAAPAGPFGRTRETFGGSARRVQMSYGFVRRLGRCGRGTNRVHR
jgi:hypothetical protein